MTTIAAGGTVIAPLVSGALADEIRLRGRGEQPLLTPAESVVLNLAADGLSSQEIAGQLGVTVQTVKARLARICTKFGVADRAGAVARAFRLGLLS
ncbi:LuxR C-terminal-related transcriptional regulator [Rhodococcus koreensis]